MKLGQFRVRAVLADAISRAVWHGSPESDCMSLRGKGFASCPDRCQSGCTGTLEFIDRLQCHNNDFIQTSMSCFLVRQYCIHARQHLPKSWLATLSKAFKFSTFSTFSTFLGE